MTAHNVLFYTHNHLKICELLKIKNDTPQNREGQNQFALYFVVYSKGYKLMLKKVIFILYLLFLPITIAKAYPNEPNGYASLYWGESVGQVQLNYNISYLRYTNRGNAYLVTIPNANGELGMLGQVSIICYFDNTNSLRSITIFMPRAGYQVESTFYDCIRDIADTCGAPTMRNGAAVWSGNQTMMAVTKKPDTVTIELMQTSYIGSLR